MRYPACTDMATVFWLAQMPSQVTELNLSELRESAFLLGTYTGSLVNDLPSSSERQGRRDWIKTSKRDYFQWFPAAPFLEPSIFDLTTTLYMVKGTKAFTKRTHSYICIFYISHGQISSHIWQSAELWCTHHCWCHSQRRRLQVR